MDAHFKILELREAEPRRGLSSALPSPGADSKLDCRRRGNDKKMETSRTHAFYARADAGKRDDAAAGGAIRGVGQIPLNL